VGCGCNNLFIWVSQNQYKGGMVEQMPTDPTSETDCPARSTWRLPKMSLKEPASENDTEDAIDHPETTQPRLVVFPRSVPMSVKMDVATIKPQPNGATVDIPMNWPNISLLLAVLLVQAYHDRKNGCQIGLLGSFRIVC
jgi:hypothetical protein